MVGVPPNTSFAIGYVHNNILPLGNMSFQTITGRSDGVFWWFPALSEDQDFFFVEFTKTILWL